MNTLEIRVIQTTGKNIKFDFFVDTVQLSKTLGVDRLQDMQYASFDLDIFEVDAERFPSYNRLEVIKQALKAFLGMEKPQNQWGSDRIVLYRCHCGCDYCGVISFAILLTHEYVYWSDLRLEGEHENGEKEIIETLTELKFTRENYENVFNEFYTLYCL